MPVTALFYQDHPFPPDQHAPVAPQRKSEMHIGYCSYYVKRNLSNLLTPAFFLLPLGEKMPTGQMRGLSVQRGIFPSSGAVRHLLPQGEKSTCNNERLSFRGLRLQEPGTHEHQVSGENSNVQPLLDRKSVV